MSDMTPAEARSLRRRRAFLWAFSLTLVAVAGTAFAFKVYEFLFVATRDGDKALVSFLIPLATYLLVAAGFVCLFLWAYFTGEFRDVERSGRRMLELQAEVDRYERAAAGRR
jgi:hypothetical protein